MALADQVTELLDKRAIEEVLYRYASATDGKEWDALREVLSEDVLGEYAGHDPVHGREALIRWIQAATERVRWGHHKLTVYSVEISGDSAKALTYHTSHSVLFDDPDTVIVKISRYRDELTRTEQGAWVIAHKVLEDGWNEKRSAPQRR